MFLNKTKLKRPRNYYIAFLGVLFFDQFLKNLCLNCGRLTRNPNALFGMETNPVFASAALFLLLSFAAKKNNKDFALALAFLSAGIISNLVDRIRFGFVIDYISLPGLFVFNIADIAILCGAGIFVWQIMKE